MKMKRFRADRKDKRQCADSALRNPAHNSPKLQAGRCWYGRRGLSSKRSAKSRSYRLVSAPGIDFVIGDRSLKVTTDVPWPREVEQSVPQVAPGSVLASPGPSSAALRRTRAVARGARSTCPWR